MEHPYDPNVVLENALNGLDICSNCPAYCDTEYTNRERRSHEVHPGYFNPDSDLMVVFQEPTHPIKWDKYNSWEEYNKVSGQNWIEKRGHHVSELLPDRFELEDLWITDAVKCPPPYELEQKPDGSYERDYDTPLEDQEGCAEARELEKEQCRPYLREELQRVNPEWLVGMGNPACNALLEILDPDFPIFEIGTGKHGGLVLPTDPPLVVSPHWSHNWLTKNPHEQNFWGGAWLRDRPDLQDESLDTYSQMVRKSLQSVIDGKLP